MSLDLAWAVMFDPFNDDGVGLRTVSDRVVQFRAVHWCHGCSSMIPKGAHGRSMRVVLEGDGFAGYRWCGRCTAAMAAEAVTGLDIYEARIEPDGYRDFLIQEIAEWEEEILDGASDYGDQVVSVLLELLAMEG